MWHPELDEEVDGDANYDAGVLQCRGEVLATLPNDVVDPTTLLEAHCRQRHLNFIQLRQWLKYLPRVRTFLIQCALAVKW